MSDGMVLLLIFGPILAIVIAGGIQDYRDAKKGFDGAWKDTP